MPDDAGRDRRPGDDPVGPPSRLRRPAGRTPSDPPAAEPAEPSPTGAAPVDAALTDESPAEPSPSAPSGTFDPAGAPRPVPRPAGPRATRPPAPEPPRWYRRRRVLVAGGVLLVLVAGLVWVVVTGLLARGHLEQARGEAGALQREVTAGGTDPADVDARVARIAQDARRAHQLTTGPAWAVTAAVPWLGSPAAVTRGLTREVDRLANGALPALGRVSDRVAGGGLRDGGKVDLTALATLTPDVRTAAQGFGSARDDLADLPTSTWLGPVDRARDVVAGQVDTLAGALGSADTALQVLPTMLGADTPQRYFVAFQNNAEIRGTGGLPGAFGIVTASRGTVTFERFESDDTLLTPAADVTGQVDFGDEQADYLAQYGYDLPFADYRESNESPHFPYAARIWAAMWQRYSGEQVTGVVALDPTALGYLVRAVGGVELADGSTLTADNVVAVTQRDVYAKYPGLDNASREERKAYLLDVAARAEKALFSAGADTATLLRGASRAASERRLLVWSADPAVQAVLADTAVGGTLPATDQPFGMLTVLNVAGTKLDYYLDRQVSVVRSGCGDTRDVTVRITVTNRAPASGLPPYVTFRADDPPADTPVGSNRWVLDWFATSGALLQGITVDGEASSARTFDQRGHPVFRTIVETPPGGSHTVVLRLREPAGTEPVTLLAQPGVRPITQDVVDDGC